jgi:hypothetical protein
VAEATHAEAHACLQAVLFASAAVIHKVELEMYCLSLKTTLFYRVYDDPEGRVLFWTDVVPENVIHLIAADSNPVSI